MEDRLTKLRELQKKREEAQDANLESTKAEAFKKQENPKEIAKLARQKEKFQKLKEKRDAQEQGLDYERTQNLTYSVEEVEKWNKKMKKKKKGADTGFSDYATLAYRKYKKQIEDMKPDLTEYNQSKLVSTSEDQIFASANSLEFLNYKPPKDKVNVMINDLNSQIEKRNKFSKRRAHKDDTDITYINDRNLRFNKKIARAYDAYTEDLKQNLENGTAL